MSRTVAIIQARMSSERLPGKVMKTVKGRPLLGFLLRQLQSATALDQIVVATSRDPSDQLIVDYCEKSQVACYRGDLRDVLSRFDEAATAFQAEAIVRICADCPLLDPQIVDRLVLFYKKHQSPLDYASNFRHRTYPRGQEVEIFSRKILALAQEKAAEAEEREHVTPYFYRHPEQFRLGEIFYSDNLSSQRWVVDTPEDFQFIERVLKSLPEESPCYHLEDVLKVLKEHPDWLALNAHVRQKEVRK